MTMFLGRHLEAKEEWNLYLEKAARLQEHLHEVDADATRYVPSCRKNGFTGNLGDGVYAGVD
eukprot:2058124-Amphidinium_carterae.1